MKYVILDDDGIEMAIVFSDLIQHERFATAFGINRIKSAGFINLDTSTITTYGKSVSLQMHSRPEDTELVKRSLAFKI